MPGRRPQIVIRRVHSQALAAARRLNLRPNDTIVVGISGGPDSTALLDALSDIRQQLGIPFNLRAAHLIHDFRTQEKYDDARFVADLCQRHGWALTVEETDVSAYQQQYRVSSFEQAARDLRYQFLAQVAIANRARFVAVAHTADDLAETVLLHVARGSGLHGLRAMRELSPWPYPGNPNPPQLWRPLLETRRADTIAYCNHRRIGYCDDSTNYMPDFARNRVRLNLMPALAEQLNPQIVPALARLARTAAVQLDYLEERANEHWPAVAPENVDPDGALRLQRQKLAALHPAMQALLLRKAWQSVTGNNNRLTENHLRQLQRIAAENASGKTVTLPGGYSARTHGQWLELSPSRQTDACPYPDWPGDFRITLPAGPIAIAVTKRGGWEVTAEIAHLNPDSPLNPGDPMRAYLSLSALANGAIARTWQPGDRIRPLGMSGHRKLQDAFTDAGIPRQWRNRIPLVTTPAGIAWAVGVRLAHWAAVQRNEGGAAAAVLLTFRSRP